MTSYLFGSAALRDLRNIWNHISADNLKAADEVEKAIYDTCQSIGSMPSAGLVRQDFTPRPVRFHLLLPYRTYWIIYDPASTPIEIIRILHTSMDVPATLL